MSTKAEKLLNSLKQEECIKLLLASMVPHSKTTDQFGHSEQISIKLHPAFAAELKKNYEEYKVKYPSFSDYIRCLLALGQVVFQAYHEQFSDVTKEYNSLQYLYSREILKKQLKEIAKMRKIVDGEKFETLPAKIENIFKIDD